MAIRYLERPPRRPRDPRLAGAYRQIRSAFGTLPEPLVLFSSTPELFLTGWATLRESLVVGVVPRPCKEAVAATIAERRSCSYCLDSHSLLLHATGESRAAAAIRKGRTEAIPDPRVRSYSEWATATFTPSEPLCRQPLFTAEEAPEAIGTALCFHYITRIATVLLGTSPIPLPTASLRGAAAAGLGRLMARTIADPGPAGASLEWVPEEEPLPELLVWSRPSPTLTAAFAGYMAAVDRAAAELLTPAARAAVRRKMASWQGEEMPFGEDWLPAELKQLPAAQRIGARLVLLAALAPYRIDEREIHHFREHFPGDAPLVALLAWGSSRAAFHMMTWWWPPEAKDTP